MFNRQSRFKSVFILPAVLLLSPLQAQAAHFSDLIIVQQAAQTGMWTSVSGGTLEDGSPVPRKTETMCATKEEILQNFNHAMYFDNRTGKENKDCPTKLTTNSTNLGVASMTCPAQKLVVAGKPFNMPGFTAIAEFKRVNSNQWMIKFGKMFSTVTYHGAATAGCINNRK
jgi:hypothetical protein